MPIETGELSKAQRRRVLTRRPLVLGASWRPRHVRCKLEVRPAVCAERSCCPPYLSSLISFRAVAVPTPFVSTNDSLPTRNALSTAVRRDQPEHGRSAS